MKIAIYPGSFDPFHQGHLNIIKKALKLFDKLYVIVSINPDKPNQSSIDKRLKDVQNSLINIENIEILANKDDFIANVALKLGANFIVRSARDKTDFEYELELAAGNKHLNNNLETILILPDYDFIEFSSTLERHRRKLDK